MRNTTVTIGLYLKEDTLMVGGWGKIQGKMKTDQLGRQEQNV